MAAITLNCLYFINKGKRTNRNILSIMLVLICIFSIEDIVYSGDINVIQTDKKDFVMVYTRSTEDSFSLWAYLIYKEALRRMGLNLIFETYPNKRCSYLANDGKVDGEISRYYDYNEKYKNLIRVEEPLSSITWAAYAINPSISLNGWSSLKGTNYRIDYRLGTDKVDSELSKIVNKENLTTVRTVPQGLKKLLTGRTDIYVDVEGTVMIFLNSKEFQSNNIINAGIMEQGTLHTFLHKKNSKYITTLSKILKDMKDEGVFNEYMLIVQEKFKNENSH
ncbi:MAG: transporter substrate-binding domain-containing protein [Nitrospirae bacterium]|nr:transporter substrate-binding domain-containing protein [Nitrospirota bacterium]